jgi:hypothetical protein
LIKIKQELNILLDIWRKGGENNNSVWGEVSKRFVDIE